MSPILIEDECGFYLYEMNRQGGQCGSAVTRGTEMIVLRKAADWCGRTADEMIQELKAFGMVVWGDDIPKIEIDRCRREVIADRARRNFEIEEIDQEIQDQMPEMDGRGRGCLAALLGL